MKHKLFILVLLLNAGSVFAQQLNVAADMRMRYEYRHGYTALFYDSLKAANFITQRTRLNIDFENGNLKFRISPQNTRVWGEVATTAKSDPGNQLHEAWAEYSISKKFSLKAGRQELNYDDARILGNADWAMQARSHDLILFKIKPDTVSSLHIGIAANANKEANAKEDYAMPFQYEAMQFAWYNGKFGNTTLSFLLLNQGIPYISGTEEKLSYNQTFGPRITTGNKRFNADAAAYLQTGKSGGNKVSASYFTGNISYKTKGGFVPGAGFEYLSGRAGNSTSPDVKSFNPWYGTNHKFNGYMDYFYVGNHINSVGLTDVYLNFGYESQKTKLKLTPHYFAAAAPLYSAGASLKKYLGTEVDFMWKVSEAASVSASVAEAERSTTPPAEATSSPALARGTALPVGLAVAS